MKDTSAESILENVQLHTTGIVASAFQQGFELPFKVQHLTTEGETLYSVEVVRNEDEPTEVRYLPSDEPWSFQPVIGSKITVTLTDRDNQSVGETYALGE